MLKLHAKNLAYKIPKCSHMICFYLYSSLKESQSRLTTWDRTIYDTISYLCKLPWEKVPGQLFPLFFGTGIREGGNAPP